MPHIVRKDYAKHLFGTFSCWGEPWMGLVKFPSALGYRWVTGGALYWDHWHNTPYPEDLQDFRCILSYLDTGELAEFHCDSVGLFVCQDRPKLGILPYIIVNFNCNNQCICFS